jgi:F-type H+-transporting ATPase subunit gamma
MANLKEVRTRIESVNSTKQITSAMKMVAASKLRKSQNAILALRPYAEKFSEILERLTANGQQSMVNGQQPTVNRVLIIPLSSNKGLCGVFNANVIRETINLIKNEYQDLLDDNRLDILCIGSKVEESLKFKKYPVVGNENVLLDDLTYDNAASFAERLMKDFEDKKYDKIVFVYNQFKNAATQVLVTEQFLPVISQQSTDNSQQSEVDYIYMPNKEDIFNVMLPKSLKMQVYKILLDSFASEQGARMISMTQATDNATELLKELNLSYNKARQSAITNELVEIVSGANALKNS